MTSRTRARTTRVLAAALVLVVPGASPLVVAAAHAPTEAPARAPTGTAFEQNLGQFPAEILFATREAGRIVGITAGGIEIHSRLSAAITLTFVGSGPTEVRGDGPVGGGWTGYVYAARQAAVLADEGYSIVGLNVATRAGSEADLLVTKSGSMFWVELKNGKVVASNANDLRQMRNEIRAIASGGDFPDGFPKGLPPLSRTWTVRLGDSADAAFKDAAAAEGLRYGVEVVFIERLGRVQRTAETVVP